MSEKSILKMFCHVAAMAPVTLAVLSTFVVVVIVVVLMCGDLFQVAAITFAVAFQTVVPALAVEAYIVRAVATAVR